MRPPFGVSALYPWYVAYASPPAQAALMVRRIRRVGLDRILFGSDAAVGGNLRPREQWAALRRLPLTPDELDRIAHNVAPYFR